MLRIRDPGWEKNPDQKQFWLKILKFFDTDPDAGSGINISDPQHCMVRYIFKCRAPPYSYVPSFEFGLTPRLIGYRSYNIYAGISKLPLLLLFYRRYSFMTRIRPENLPPIFHTETHTGSVVDLELFGKVGFGSELSVPDPDLDLSQDLTFLTIIVANCS